MTRRRRSAIVRARRAAHVAEVILGDARAVQRNRVPQRIVNRVGGRLLSKVLRGLWR